MTTWFSHGLNHGSTVFNDVHSQYSLGSHLVFPKTNVMYPVRKIANNSLVYNDNHFVITYRTIVKEGTRQRLRQHPQLHHGIYRIFRSCFRWLVSLVFAQYSREHLTFYTFVKVSQTLYSIIVLNYINLFIQYFMNIHIRASFKTRRHCPYRYSLDCNPGPHNY